MVSVTKPQTATGLRRKRFHRKTPWILIAFAFSSATVAAAACSATGDRREFPDKPNTGSSGTGGAGGNTGAGGNSSSGFAGGLIVPDAGSDDASPDVFINPCGSQCGPKELCDEQNLGLDDDCDGLVDEDCSCSAGQVHWCFRGDPSYHGAQGCFDGTEKCTENGMWGDCIGGVHATENCFANDTTLCHPITATPFQDVDLKTGTGNFSLNAVPGSEIWTVSCPQGVNPCPAVSGMNPPDDFKPLQSGEYTVTYTKQAQGGGMESCTYPLFVGARGLRVELQWEHDLGGDGLDLDLHVHQPNNTAPWGIDGVPEDCTWSNCVFDDFTGFGFNEPNWFQANAMPPDPVNWYLDPVFEMNTCYFAPRGVGSEWQGYGQGCHNPRLDLDNITCDPAESDVNSFDFCAPENVNIDFPPQKEWTRIAVHYYSNHAKDYDVHPVIKVFCDGALTAELGPTAYYDPESPVTFAPYDGSGGASENRFWMVADVAFRQDMCGGTGCIVKPIYSDPVAKTPFFTFASAAEADFGPPYPPPLP